MRKTAIESNVGVTGSSFESLLAYMKAHSPPLALLKNVVGLADKSEEEDGQAAFSGHGIPELLFKSC